MIKNIFILLVLILTFACRPKVNESNQNEDCGKILAQLKTIDLPFKTSNNSLDKSLIDKSVKWLDLVPIFKDSNYRSEIIGLIGDTTQFYRILWITGVEGGLPIISVFDKKYNLISEEQLYRNVAGGCEYTSSEYLQIDQKLNIQIIDTITERLCDSTDNQIIKKYYTVITNGLFSKNGLILFEKQDTIGLDITNAR